MTDADPPVDPTRYFGEGLVSAEIVAAHLGVDRATVFRLAGVAGGLPVIDVGNRIKRFRVSDVKAYVERRTRSAQGRAERLLGARRR